ncbi:MAG TPA: adenylate kinase [Thermoclostridium sp.]|nr:adenylate kinase [Thermoclostridium sp.]
MRLVIMGAPGAGKGTQAVNLSKILNIPHISTGEIFRHHIEDGTQLGLKAKGYIDDGLLVPDELTIKIVKDRILKQDCKRGFLLDGFPRTIPQAEQLDKLLDDNGIKLDAVINLKVCDDVIVKRMEGRRVCKVCGRSYHIDSNPPKVEGICDFCKATLTIREDDTRKTVLERLKTYYRKTTPLIDYYDKYHLLLHFDGTKGIMETTEEIMAGLLKKQVVS